MSVFARVSSSLSIVAVALLAAACGTSPEFVDEPADPSDPASAEDPPLVGHWNGYGHQSNGSEWDVVLDINHLELGPCATVRYPSVGCSGYWECVSSDGEALKAIERITRGKKRCVDGVAVQVGVDYGGERLWYVARAEGETAVARLRRAQ